MRVGNVAEEALTSTRENTHSSSPAPSHLPIIPAYAVRSMQNAAHSAHLQLQRCLSQLVLRQRAEHRALDGQPVSCEDAALAGNGHGGGQVVASDHAHLRGSNGEVEKGGEKGGRRGEKEGWGGEGG